MRTIEITTTQNVTIEYELATFRDRFFAFILDLVIIIITTMILSLMFELAFSGKMQDYMTYLIILPFMFFYTFASELWMDGQTLGKKALNIKVVKLDGRQPLANDYFTRWAFRMLDIWFSLGTVAAILVSSSSKAQRLGGVLSNTTVIKKNPALNMTLSDILKINTRDNYTPKYPEVTRFNEQDMLLIKTVIERVKKHPNKAHQEALNELVSKAEQTLGIPKIHNNKIGFLKTLVNDYIVLTR